MRRLVTFATLCLAAGLLLVAASPVAARDSATRASLLLVDDNPLRLTGTRFRARERVKVRAVVSGRTISKIVTANVFGRFTAQLSVDAECFPFVVTAEGARGSRATLRRIRIPPACGPPPAP